ncbi:DUF2332 family protein [Salipiger sp. IMCC34102]|uniref:DUF2332 domain-containing protein n=1 Tax=Salipiger sp. IMCC34102 TaxID=2510647 RepID=UPI00101BD3C1|nr:DUF2332 family protein [Salipiger sp. IMCC34102]RYH01877.1 DUF2332 family protein [Salipiger sp. IMCC34102]
MTPDKVRAAFADQARSCADLGSPFMARLCTLFATRDWPAGAVRDRVFGWPGDISSQVDSVPLRLAGALHALRLEGDRVLGAVYPPRDCAEKLLWEAVCDRLVAREDWICAFLDSPPQTNEVRRSAAIIAAAHWLAAWSPLPLRTSELGASGGLNLMWDRYALALPGGARGPDEPALTLTPDWEGALPPEAQPIVAARRGVDLRPLDPNDAGDALRLQAYLWPDQPERLANTRAAIAVAGQAPDRADAIDWLAPRLDHVPGQMHLIYHTVAWQYFPRPLQDRGRALIEAAGASATKDAPLAWFGMEADDTGPGAALTLRLWPGDLTIALGRADFHGRWINWTAPAPRPN